MTKIDVKQVNKKKYAHSYRFTNSTSEDFSSVQPLCCRLLYPHGKIKGKMSQFVRLNAMPLPTFGDIRLRNYASFVPIEDIFPNFSAMMSELTVTNSSGTTFVPKSFPSTTNSSLWNCLCNVGSMRSLATFTTWVNSPLDAENGTEWGLMPFGEWVMRYYDKAKETGHAYEGLEEWQRDLYDEFTFALAKAYKEGKITLAAATRAYYYRYVGVDLGEDVKVDETTWLPTNSTKDEVNNFINAQKFYDYVNVTYSGDIATSTAQCYRLSDKGRRLRKILLGLGYQPSADDKTIVNVLPLLAFYKAYYERFIPFRDKPFTATKCYALIRYIEDTAKPEFAFTASTSGNINVTFMSFITDELAECYSTKEMSFAALHMSTLDNGFKATLPTTKPDWNVTVSNTVSSVNLDNNISNVPGSQTVNVASGQGVTIGDDTYVHARKGGVTGMRINAMTLRMLNKMYGYFGRNSLIGNRIRLWAQTNLDSETYNNLFRSSTSIASNEVRMVVGDIDSTANTLNGDSTINGSALGAYAGKGIGSGDLKFSFESETYGYFLILSWVDPMTDMWQGTDTQLFALTKYEVPQAEFDAMGYEITPYSAFWTDNGLSLGSDTAQSNVVISNSDGFGYVPRYSAFKHAKNIVNGDMSLRSISSSMSPFYLDRTIHSRDFEVAQSGSAYKAHAVVNAIPRASTAWRYTQRDEFMGNYNRIFYNSDPTPLSAPTPWGFVDGFIRTMGDNFFVHCVFDITEVTPLKPLSMSYDTLVNSGDTDHTITPA